MHGHNAPGDLHGVTRTRNYGLACAVAFATEQPVERLHRRRDARPGWGIGILLDATVIRALLVPPNRVVGLVAISNASATLARPAFAIRSRTINQLTAHTASSWRSSRARAAVRDP
jgi:hypothetical protein